MEEGEAVDIDSQPKPEPKRKNRVLRILKYFFVTISIVVGALLLTAFIIIYFYEDKIREAAVKEINKKLNTEIQVSDINLTLISTFPDASLEFSNVSALEVLKSDKKDTLLKADAINLYFNFWDIFYGTYDFNKIKVNNGKIRLRVFKNGSDNFHILKEDTTDSDQGVSFNLEKVIFKDIHFDYKDKKQDLNIDFSAHKLVFIGKFRDEEYAMYALSNMYVNEFSSSGVNFISKQSVSFKIDLDVAGNERYTIRTGQLSYLGQTFGLSGKLKWSDAEKSCDINITGEEVDLDKIRDHVPERFGNMLKEYEMDGIVEFTAHIDGPLLGNQSPVISADFSMTDGSFTYKNTGTSLSNIQTQGKYTNGEKRSDETTTISLSGFSAKLGTGYIKGNVQIENLKNPLLRLKAEASMALPELLSFAPSDTIEEISGDVILNVDFESRMNASWEFKPSDFVRSKTTGKASLSNVTVKLRGDKHKYEKIAAKLRFNNNDIEIEALSGNIDNSDFRLEGVIRNALSFIFLENQKLYVDASLESTNISLDEILTSDGSASGEDYKIVLPSNIFFDLTAKIDAVTFRKFSARNLKGTIAVVNSSLQIPELRMETMNGNITIQGGVIDASGTNLMISCIAKLQKVDIKSLFRQMENFGQNYMTENNLDGIITADIEFASAWTPELVVIEDKLYALIKLTIEKGKLIDYKPLEGLGSFIETESLKNVSFQTLSNTIEIRNKVIFIPSMEINSSVMSLSLFGQHTFDNKIDYHLTVLRSELPAVKDKLKKKQEKARQENEEFGVEIDDGLGKTKYFIHVFGTADNPQYKYDKLGLKNKLKDDIHEEKEKLKDILREEFGWFKKDSLNRHERDSLKQINKKKKDEEGDENKFKIEFE
ncbi:MAG: hypothetical protein KKA07_13995 [Bacteroidetes bacterium]|nr:hypothetical protein [Bacteroidota bacterium]MBU1720174.1 hypothetical protein [Bacteroidota bacterium]